MQANEEIIESVLEEKAQLSEEESPLEKNYQPESEDFKTFLSLFIEMKDPEEKIRKAIDFMRARLSSFASPRFREFWEIRKLCLPLFKEALSAKSRAELWQQYVDLSVEARRLKEILDEQSAFAYEQIDLAVQSLVQDLAAYKDVSSQSADIALILDSLSLKEKAESYNQMQKELHFLNAFAAKVNALRKEVIKTDMRIRNKNKLFERLSACGDSIFPKRKEFIKKISEDFMEDVALFVSKHFASGRGFTETASLPLHALREEIKSLQSIAKILTLNTHSFTDTRVKLSSCWDLVREVEKEKKKEFNEKKAQSQQNFEQIMLQVKEFSTFCAEEVEFSSVEKRYQELFHILKGVELGRMEFKTVKDQMDLAKKPHEDKKRLQLEELQDKEKKAEDLRFLKVQEFRSDLQSLLDSSSENSFEELTSKRSVLEEAYKMLVASKAEKALLDKMFKQLKDKMLEAKGRSLLSLSDDEQEQYEGLKQLLKEKKERRQEMKAQLEVYRKSLSGSSLDFEKAMACRDLMDAEKASLDKINADIEEIEGKIAELEG